MWDPERFYFAAENWTAISNADFAFLRRIPVKILPTPILSILIIYSETFLLNGFQVNIFIRESQSSVNREEPVSLGFVRNESLLPNGIKSSSQDTDCRISIFQGCAMFAKDISCIFQSKIDTLDAAVPGLIPQFNSKPGAISQPATMQFIPSEHLRLSWNPSDTYDIGNSTLKVKSINTLSLLEGGKSRNLNKTYNLSFLHGILGWVYFISSWSYAII